eukprot:CAMPEP_0198255910 /NCGR_PEP_ID=MMETSP1447-20131203/5936_1 /TAXON_ID=420782 /ORGANISM="Chaetoceros dichaeta, Strain CCMP1751" /LENGTH=466 /DNA_ID=CAMNT_0043942409 /DNA_START=56 /DNA_END=1452 /DNA_ORIENTATION=-
MRRNFETIHLSMSLWLLVITILICHQGSNLQAHAFSTGLQSVRTSNGSSRCRYRNASRLPNLSSREQCCNTVTASQHYRLRMSTLTSPTSSNVKSKVVIIPSPSPLSPPLPQPSPPPLPTVPSPTTTTTPTTTSSTKSSSLSSAAKWHQTRRKAMIARYSDQLVPLEQSSHGLFIGLPLLILSNVALTCMSIRSGSWSMPKIIMLSFFPGSIFSLWQLQICHDALHGSLLPKPSATNTNSNNTQKSRLTKYIHKNRKTLHQKILFYGSMPSAFGYYLYLHFGHLTHHKSFGDPTKASLAQLFNSSQKNFEDGDALFVAHRMKLKGAIGPTFPIPRKLQGLLKQAELTMSISKTGLNAWKPGRYLHNALIFLSSLLFERILLVVNDGIVATTGRNYFFPNKPTKGFHNECATYCRVAVGVRLLLCGIARSWKPLVFLYFAETLWSVPPHPACAMFITNHGSDEGGAG